MYEQPNPTKIIIFHIFCIFRLYILVLDILRINLFLVFIQNFNSFCSMWYNKILDWKPLIV
jgi:hypothetical protein